MTLFIVPGVIYFFWRNARRQWVCASCGSPELVALDSPRGRQLSQDSPELAHPRVCPSCGREIATSARFCKFCGVPTSSDSAQASARPPTATQGFASAPMASGGPSRAAIAWVTVGVVVGLVVIGAMLGGGSSPRDRDPYCQDWFDTIDRIQAQGASLATASLLLDEERQVALEASTGSANADVRAAATALYEAFGQDDDTIFRDAMRSFLDACTS